MMLEEHGNESPTDFLMRILQDFSTDEPTKVVVIFTTESGALQVSTNKLERSTTIGLLVEAQNMIVHDWLSKESK